MSKKIAEGTSALVLDVKVGTGAFMKDLAKARELAHTLVDLGEDAGVSTSAIITDMSTPLGRAVGNGLEVTESVEILAGGGPADVRELTVVFARELLARVGMEDVDPAAALNDGRAMDSWRKMIAAQGGDPDATMPEAPHVEEVRAESDGVITRMDALGVGIAAWRLGAGRARKEDPVQVSAGVYLHKTLGEPVSKGDVIMTLHTETPDRMPRGLEALAEACDGKGAVEIAASGPARKRVVLERIGTAT
jgi:thymidine phosphorylase